VRERGGGLIGEGACDVDLVRKKEGKKASLTGSTKIRTVGATCAGEVYPAGGAVGQERRACGCPH